jgi:hypothetical protein
VKFLTAFPLVILMSFTANVTAADNDRAVEQQRLDAACEAARQKKLAPVRQAEIKKCMTEQKKDRETCDKEFSHYGERSGNRPPLFYDLPECKQATDFRNSYRQAR